MNATYGGGNSASGPRGYEKVGLAGIHVDRQVIGICDYVAEYEWQFKPIGGIMGLSRIP